MPFTAAELTKIGTHTLDFYLKNKPIDQIAVERPLLKKLMEGKKSFPGGKQYIVEQLRDNYSSNFQWYHGEQAVTYNKKNTLKQSNFAWGGCHDGFSLNEDELLTSGIVINDKKPKSNSSRERALLTDMLQEHLSTLRLGFEEKFAFELHQDGTQDPEAIAGLDALVATDPTTGTVGGLDAATNVWWRNQRSAAVAQGDLIEEMEKMWQECTRYGDSQPDYIEMGTNALDTFRGAAKAEISRYMTNDDANNASYDPAATGFKFKGVPIKWGKDLLQLQADTADAISWENRIYMINCKHLKLRPAQGHDMISRTPPREHNIYAYYWGLTWKGTMTTNMRRAHGVIDVA